MIEMMLFTLVIGMIGAVCGWYGREWYAKRIIRLLEKRVQGLAQEMEKRAIEVRVEHQGEVFYVYNAKTDEFLAQGTSHDQITKTLNDRFPNTFFIADKDHLRDLGYKHDSI